MVDDLFENNIYVKKIYDSNNIQHYIDAKKFDGHDPEYYLCSHPDVDIASDTTSQSSINLNEPFVVIDEITKDEHGHIEKINTKVVTIIGNVGEDGEIGSSSVSSSDINGNIKINGVETEVYIHPPGPNPHNVTKSDIDLENVGNFKAVSTEPNQMLTEEEKVNARNNIGAITDIKMNGESKGNSGIIDLGVVLTSHQSLTDYVKTTDNRLSDSRNAKDVYSWAKASVKPSYTASEIGLDKVGNYKAVSTESGQYLTNTEQANARNNIGAGTSNFSGSYADLWNKPTMPTVSNGTLVITNNNGILNDTGIGNLGWTLVPL